MFPRSTTVSEASVHELEHALSEGATLIDVRESHEYTAGHVPGARLMPLGSVPGRARGELEGEDRVYVICASGSRSEYAAQLLSSRGIDAVNVAGGTGAWLRAGKPVERGL